MLPNKDATNPKKITLKNIYNYIRAKLRIFYVWVTSNYIDKEDPVVFTIESIVEERLEGVLKNSPKCIEKGYCIHCGCPFPDKLYEQESCEYGCYGPWPINTNVDDNK